MLQSWHKWQNNFISCAAIKKFQRHRAQYFVLIILCGIMRSQLYMALFVMVWYGLVEGKFNIRPNYWLGEGKLKTLFLCKNFSYVEALQKFPLILYTVCHCVHQKIVSLQKICSLFIQSSLLCGVHTLQKISFFHKIVFFLKLVFKIVFLNWFLKLVFENGF